MWQRGLISKIVNSLELIIRKGGELMGEFGEVPNGVIGKGIGKEAVKVPGKAGVGSDVVGVAGETGEMFVGQIVRDAEAIIADPSGNAEIYGTMPIVPSKPFEDEDPRRLVADEHASRQAIEPVKPLENLLNPNPVVSAPVEAPAPVIEIGGTK